MSVPNDLAARSRAGNLPRRAACLPRLLAGATALLLTAMVPAQAQPGGAAVPGADARRSDARQADARRYDIAAGPLAQAIASLGRSSGVTFSYDPALVQDRHSPGLAGVYRWDQALAALLAGTGVQAQALSNGAYTLRPAPAASGGVPVMPAALVQASLRPLQDEGSAEQGYRARTASSVGALGSLPLRETPYAFTVVPQALMANIQAQSPDDVYRVNPSTVSQTPQGTGWAPMVKIRGFSSYDRAEDGLRRAFGFATSLEDKERVEVLSGLSGFLFGAASPGGMVNYVSKRPTADRLNSVTLGNYGGSQYYVHGDFAGPVDAGGRVGYRLNVVRQNGETAVDDQKIDRSLVSAALDLRPTDRLTLELNASYSDYRMDAPTAYWTFREGVPRIKAPDASKNWSQPWIEDRIESRKWSARAIYEASDHLTLRFAHLRDRQDRPKQDHTMNSVRSPTEYYQIRIHSGETRTESQATQALADLSFSTGPLEHKVTAGYYGFSDRQWSTRYSPNTGYLGPNGFDRPTHVPEPAWPAVPADASYYAGRARNDNFLIGDLIKLGEHWSALVGINHSRIESTALGVDGQRQQPDYDKSRNSPNVSLMFNPNDWLTAYATYIEGLEQGGVAPQTASNALAVMPPMVSKQKELGLKAELGGVLLSGALFDIEKAYEFTDAGNVYGQDGKQRHRGVEFTAVGKATDRWTVFGGVTLLTAKVEGGANDGNAPLNVPKTVAKLYSEYALPQWPGLSLTGGIYHVGKQWANNTNTSRLPSYTTVDAGLRYATRVAGKPVSLRLTVSNLTGRDYWLNSYYLGAPRSVAFSAQMQF